MNERFDLTGRTVVITGGGKGIGKVYTQEFAKAGARVVAADIDGAAAKSVAEALAAQGLEAIGLATDIASEDSTKAMAQAALERFGAIDVLINNASLMSVLPRRSWLEIPVEEWDRVMAVNLRGMFLSCRAVFPAMQARKRGKIVNISSSRVWEGTPNRLHYTTSKAGVLGLTRALARGVAAFGTTMNERLGGRYDSLRHALAAGALDEMRALAASGRPDLRLAEVKFLPPIPNPEKILCAGINYRSHAAETGRDLPKQPSMFIRLANTLVGHEGELIRPSVSQKFDFEGELAIVIGRAGRHIPVERALDHVAGYTCFVDGSVRDYQKFSVSSGKNFPGTGPLGPWIITSDEIPDPKGLTLVTRLNGEVMQKAGT